MIFIYESISYFTKNFGDEYLYMNTKLITGDKTWDF
jgi:hypothetical protein